jgi:hypothetical protein
MGVLLLVSGGLLLAAQSGMTYIYDDWGYVLYRRGFSAEALLDPFNEHIVIALVAIYDGSLELFGMDTARPVQIVSDLLVLSCGALLFLYARIRVGDWLAVMAASLILFFGSAYLDLLWPINLALSGGCAAGLGALLALDRDDRRGDRIAVALLVVSVLFSEVGVAFSVGALAAVLLGDRPWRERLFIPVVPLLLYAAWWAGWGHQADSSFSLDNVLDSPAYVFDAVSQALAALVGLGRPFSGDASELVGINFGRVLLVIGAVLAVLRLRGRPVPNGVWVALAAGGAFWFSAAFNENELRPPESARILLPSGIFILLIAVNVLRDVRLGSSGLVIAAGVTALMVGSNLGAYKDGAEVFETTSETVRADLAAVEYTQDVNPGYVLSGFPWLLPVPTADYLEAVSYYDSSAAYSDRELLDAPTPARAHADAVMAAALGLALAPAEERAAASDAGCRAADASEGGGAGIEFGPGRLTITDLGGGPKRVLLARYSTDAYSVDLGGVPADGAVTLDVPEDRSDQPWLLGLKGDGRAVVCLS